MKKGDAFKKTGLTGPRHRIQIHLYKNLLGPRKRSTRRECTAINPLVNVDGCYHKVIETGGDTYHNNGKLDGRIGQSGLNDVYGETCKYNEPENFLSM